MLLSSTAVKTARALRFSRAAGCALLVICLSPKLANGQLVGPPTGQPPIRIDRCVVVSRTELRDPFNGLPEQYISGLEIRFVNLRDVSATVVRFSVRYQGSAETFTDRGTFAPNVTIDRTFANFAGARSVDDAATCNLLSATYTDETAWPAEPH